MKYKKPAFWIVVLAVMVCTVVAVCFLTDPVAAEGTANKWENSAADAANQRENSVVKWFDYLEAPEEMLWDGYLETNRPEFPDVTFRWSYATMRAVTETGVVQLYTGMPIWSVYFHDLTGDGLPELCSTLSYGSGLIDTRICIYDYANGVSYELADRGSYDYTLRLDNEDGCLYVDKKIYASNGLVYEHDELVSSGRLTFSDGYLHIVESGHSAEIADPIVSTEAPTEAPSKGFRINTDLISELGMSWLQLSEKYGDPVGGFQNVLNFEGGYGRYAWKVLEGKPDYDMMYAGGCNWIDGVTPEELFSGVSYPLSFDELENQYGFVPVSVESEPGMGDYYWAEFKFPLYDTITYVVSTEKFGFLDAGTPGTVIMNADCREAKPISFE